MTECHFFSKLAISFSLTMQFSHFFSLWGPHTRPFDFRMCLLSAFATSPVPIVNPSLSGRRVASERSVRRVLLQFHGGH